MIGDGRRLDSGRVLSFDVCVVGAGPAGLSIASELDGAGHQVCLLESAGSLPDVATESLGSGRVDENSDHYPDPMHLHTRAVGGTAHRWCVDVNGEKFFRVGRFERADFECRSWLPNSGWPIRPSEIEPYYERALLRCGLTSSEFDPSSWAEPSRRPIHSISGRMESRIFMFGRQRVFVEDLPAGLRASKNVTLLTHSTCVELETDQSGERLRRLRVRCLNGTEFFITARAVVLALGAFEVPRLLLASCADVRVGVGNQWDLVGRFLNDHKIVKAGRLVSTNRDVSAELGFYDIRRRHSVPITGALTLAEKTLDDEEILNSAFLIVPRPSLSPSSVVQRIYSRDTTARSPALDSAVAIKRSIQAGTMPPRLLTQLTSIARNADDLLYAMTRYYRPFQSRYSINDGGWFEATGRRRPANGFEAVQLCEQAPDWDNRVMITGERDALGMPRSRIRSSWGSFDQYSVCRAQEILSDELVAAGVGRLDFGRRDGAPLLTQISTHHPAGTTRMSRSPETGVVDADCRVFGTPNLFIASSSVFPTSSYTTPTLTIVALAIRIADKLKRLLNTNDLPSID